MTELDTAPIRYLICSTPRTGSNWLCDMLAGTRVAGIVDVERGGLFIGTGNGLRTEVWPHRINEYFKSVETPNGVQGCKVGMDYLEMLYKLMPYGTAEQLLHSFTHYIWLRRRNEVAQAVSWHIALRTGIYRNQDSLNPRKTPQQVSYQRDRLTHFMGCIRGWNMRWQTFFEANKIEPMHLYYEEVSADPLEAVNSILGYIGVDTKVSEVPSSITRQYDKRKSEWLNKYREQTGL